MLLPGELSGGKKWRAPKHLRPATRKWCDSVAADFELDPHHLRLLQLAGEAWDRAEEAREAIKMHGLTYLDRYNCPHARPEVNVERDSRIGFARLLRELDLDVSAPAEAKKPPSLASHRRGS